MLSEGLEAVLSVVRMILILVDEARKRATSLLARKDETGEG
jgi:hypothetical protein